MLQNYNIQVDDISMMEYIRWCQDRTKDKEEWFGIRIRGFLADKKGVTSVQLRRINLR